MENEPKYPYRDPDFGFWIYDRLPEYMEPAEPRELWPGRQEPRELWPGRHVMYRSQLPPLQGLWIAQRLTDTSVVTARMKAARGEIFIQRSK